ncbi:class I SAM-dependent methyltransferase [Azospirillum sp. TSH100]|uniref:class I SAM-dependent methyltransferase n=1 Tax=Azospirillum sp. TSH100 TaxID=652764 RepID=UPI001304FD1F|nr:class I SAM-dependent methyltransferase [Azospirillum sp. TSH100]
MMARIAVLYRLTLDLLLPERAVVRRFIAVHLAAHLAEAGQPPAPGLDIGAGPDPYGSALRRALGPGARIITVDIGPGDRVQARADAQRLPFADRSFSVVMACHLLQHVTDPRAALAEAARVMVPGGLLLVVHPFITLQGQDRDLWRWTLDGMTVEVERAGLTPVAALPVGGPLYALASIAASVPGRVLVGRPPVGRPLVGHGQGWRSGRSPADAVRLALSLALAAPFHMLARLLEPLDRALWPRAPFHAGGILLARKVDHG